MKNINLDLLFIALLMAAAVWTQFHTSDLPMLGALGLVPLAGSLITTPKKRTPRAARAGVDNFTE